MRKTRFAGVASGLALAGLVVTMPAQAAGPQAYGVTSAGSLVRFDVDAPASITPLGNLGFVPEGIDFRPPTIPGTGAALYAIDIGPTNSQLYTINLGNGAATAVGSSFASQGSVASVPYNLTTATHFGFDFNPATLQGDGSVRIRLTANNRANLRLNSDTGQVAAVDGTIAYLGTDSNAAANRGMTERTGAAVCCAGAAF